MCRYDNVVVIKERGFSLTASCIRLLQNVLSIQSNQIFHYTRFITAKRVTSLRGLSPRPCAVATTTFYEEISQRWRAVGNTVFDLTGPRFEPETKAMPLGQLAGTMYSTVVI